MEKPGVDDLFTVGTVSRVLQLLKLPDGTIKALFEGLYRARWQAEENYVPESGEFPLAKVFPLAEIMLETPERAALVRATLEAMEEYAKINKKLPQEASRY